MDAPTGEVRASLADVEPLEILERGSVTRGADVVLRYETRHQVLE